MPKPFLPYRREAALDYAARWALSRNPRYLDFTNLGGDCTNFISQCLLAGSGVENYTPTFGWYYNSASDRAPAWTGVAYLYDFLRSNLGAGPFGAPALPEELELGDLLQLADESGRFHHSLLVVGFEPDDLLVAAHDFDAWMRPLSSYSFGSLRGLHIRGVQAP